MSKTILIADSGSTKTDWRLCQPDLPEVSFKSIGLNPFFVNDKLLQKNLKNTFPQPIAKRVDEVFFYGAGCSNKTVIKPFLEGFQSHFPHAKINIHHDMLGASLALFGNEPGLAIILGTGSNSCLYNGQDVTANIPALGYVLGDEGSGADMGKRLVTKYIYGELDQSLTAKLDAVTSKEDIFNKVYSQQFPNRYLASFSSFILENIEHPQMRNLVKDSLDEFINKHVVPYPNYKKFPLGIVGSIGFIYQDILQELTRKKGLEIKKIVRSPIEEMVKYHLSK